MNLFDPEKYTSGFDSVAAHNLFGPETYKEAYENALSEEDFETIDALLFALPASYRDCILGEEYQGPVRGVAGGMEAIG